VHDDLTRERQAPRRLVAPGVEALRDDAVPHGGAADDGVPDGRPAGVPPPAGEGLGRGLGDPFERGGRLTRLPGPGPFDPGRRGVRALAAVAAVVVVVAALLAWRGQPRPEPVPAADVPPAAAVPPVAATPAAGTSPGAAPGSVAASVVVAVAGKVRRPGLVRLPSGARVADAIAAAGGLLPDADVAFLNVARRVGDGELILVGVTAPPGAVQAPPGPPGAAGAGEPGVGSGAAGLVNLNTATMAELDGLPGVGPVLAQRIIDHRERHGAFRAVEDLRQVTGIGEARFGQLRELVTV
jgi:competence protein ComEA